MVTLFRFMAAKIQREKRVKKKTIYCFKWNLRKGSRVGFFCGKIFCPLFFAVAVSNQQFEILEIKKKEQKKIKPLLPWNRPSCFFPTVCSKNRTILACLFFAVRHPAGAGMNQWTSQKRRGAATCVKIILQIWMFAPGSRCTPLHSTSASVLHWSGEVRH